MPDCRFVCLIFYVFSYLSIHSTHACRLTQRWEASLWLSGKQLYLGGFEREEDAARAYDIAALACKGPMVATNFDSSEYSEELDAVRGCSKVCS